MKKILLMIIGFGVLFTFYSCEDEEILPLPEYVAIQPASWTFGTIAVANPTFTFEFKLTTFEPQNYSISVLITDAIGLQDPQKFSLMIFLENSPMLLFLERSIHRTYLAM